MLTTFESFPRLPAEIRLMIWRLCLPSRIHELDYPFNLILYSRDWAPCEFQDGAWINGFPPLISAVCRESRAVVLENGRFPDGEEGPGWWASTSYVRSWLDPVRDRVHLNWTPAYEAEFCNNSDEGSPLEHLAWRAAQLTSIPPEAGYASFMEDWLYVSDDATPPPVLRGILSRFACWRVIVRVMVIHADRRTGAESGLFGLLGDAPVQIVDVSDHDRVEAYWRLAETQRQHDPHEQDFERVEAEAVDREVQAQAKKMFGCEAVPFVLKPAIMFRWCTQIQGHWGQLSDGEPVKPRRGAALRGRGRGRGSGRARKGELERTWGGDRVAGFPSMALNLYLYAFISCHCGVQRGDGEGRGGAERSYCVCRSSPMVMQLWKSLIVLS
ncbi:hypothetical protein BO82DRAFT_397606 [Aspergillus uvarum CBS 121591]|uniref:2EXR domain-containing protein n=1 Tax=Aspergillus uvarum CBS 121591 TaxID=1448315 RepID=A0A319D633_9EURO|nr:hypothetical protein BO82DRAFT_397606 [Aspergillus uvarum CBS 121591]PYH86433.1 hypothetical protein BO82DRAFT_397606 [Aspergillus uvarum CBS 121591]